MGGRFENARATFRRCFPFPLLARIFGSGVHPPFGRVFEGNRARRLCSPRHGRAIAVAVGVVEPQSGNRDASSARCSRARTRAREHDTRFIHARKRDDTRVLFPLSLSPLFFHVLRQTFVPQETRSRREEEEGEEG